MQRSTVLLPLPLGPMTTTTLPLPTSRLTSSTARSLAKLFDEVSDLNDRL